MEPRKEWSWYFPDFTGLSDAPQVTQPISPPSDPSRLAVPSEGLTPERSNSSDLLERFCDETTFHGVRYFASPGQKVLSRLTWLLMSIASLGLCCYTVYPQVMMWLNGEVRTTNLLEVQQSLAFPALTFCNVNMFRRSVVGANTTTARALLVLRGWPILDQESVENFCYEPNPLNDRIRSYTFFDEIQDQTVYHYMVSGHDSFQSVISCQHAGQECTENIVNHITDSNMCFTYNPGTQYRTCPKKYNSIFQGFGQLSYPCIFGTPIQLNSTGPHNGVQLVLNTHQYDYCDAGGPATQTAGFFMIAHDTEVDPLFLLYDSIRLEPGRKTEVVVKIKKYRRNTESLGRCASSVPLDYYNKKNFKYNLASCHLECITKQVNASCGCVPYYAPNEALIILGQQMDASANAIVESYMCLSVTAMSCATQLTKQLVSQTLLYLACPQCNIACDETVIEVDQISSLVWPAGNMVSNYITKKHVDFRNPPRPPWGHLANDSYFNTLRQNYLTNFARYDNFSSIEEIRENLLAVRVYVKSMMIEVTEEQPLTSMEELSSQVGGATGLFLGASVLSFFELLYWASVAIQMHVKRRQIVTSKT